MRLTFISLLRSFSSFSFFRLGMALALALTQAVMFLPARDAVAAPAEKPLLAAPPVVSLSVPATAFIGENVNFTVTFDNTDLADPGYGPLIDLIIPTNGADGAQNTNLPQDGLTFVSAMYLGVNVESTVLTFPGSGATTCVNHPYMVNSTGNPIQVCGPAGDTFVALRLPFGSFTPEQPPITVNVTLSMSNLADLDAPLTIQARGGYQFGYTPLNDFCCGDDPSQTLSAFVSGSVTPSLFTLSKSYNGPESETATGPNFPRQYTVTAQIAPGQSLSAFNLTDILPNNMQFVSMISTSPAATCSHTDPALPGGTLSCNFGAVSGTVTMTFEYYIPLRDSGGAAVIDPITGNDALSCNNASGGGTWTPIDPRDLPASLQTIDQSGCEHTLTDKSIAIQKSVSVVGGGAPMPGRVLEYTLDIQVSDFFVFNNLVVTDVFSDGQRWDTTFTPTVEVNGNSYTLSALGMNAANYTVDISQIGNSGPNPPLDGTDGSTTVTFQLSDEISARGQDGRLIGGCIPVAGTGGSDPDCGSYNDGPTTARIVFRTVIQQNFSDTYPSGDPSVDQGDTLDNTVTVSGALLAASDASTPTDQSEEDGSSASVAIGRGSLTKSVYAINGSTSFSVPVEVKPGDTVTYRLTYTLPTGDVENLSFDDYLPLPVFSVDDPDADGASGPAWLFNAIVNAAAPAAGVAKFGPADTFFLYSTITPSITPDPGNNRLRFGYGNFDGVNEQQYTIDLLFTVAVSADPFADRLHLTNQAHAFEDSTNAGTAAADAIVQIILTQPVLVHTKGIVAAANSNAVFSPTTVGPVTFNAPGTAGARWSGTVDSTNLAANPINSNISGVDAGDLVTFAIVIENLGSSAKGAFDITISDTLPAMYQIPGGGLNLRVANGDNSQTFTYTDQGGGLFGSGIRIDDPDPDNGAWQSYTATGGRNILIITYDLEVRPDVAPGTQQNIASLLGYAGSDGGPNHLPEPEEDDATSTVFASAAKTIVSTQIENSVNTRPQVVIGEIVTYTLTITVPEGRVPGAFVLDQLDNGLAFVSCVSVSGSSGDVTTDLAGGFAGVCATTQASGVTNSGRNIRFDLGAITNANRDNALPETITITYTAVALNVIGNQSATLLNNAAQFLMNAGSGDVILASASAPNVTVIEPQVNTAKSVLPPSGDAGDTVTFTVTLTNPAGGTTAYDVSWLDILNSNLTYVPASLTHGTCTASTPPVLDASAAPTLTASGGLLEPGQSCQITLQAVIGYAVSPGNLIPNTAATQWTSMPGVVNDISTYNLDDSDERTGADGIGGALNDYRSSASVNVSINNIVPQKYLAATSEAHTGVVAGTSRVAIGEIVRYRLVVQLPEGTSANFQIRDNLPAGLLYLDDGTARLALLSNGVPIASTNPAGDTLGLGLGNGPFGAGPWVNGNDPTVVTPTYLLPDQNVGSTNSLTDDPDSYSTGTDPFFKLGALTNNDNDADEEFVIVEFNALVDNTAGGSNDAGDTRGNTFSVFISGAQNGLVSNQVQVIIAEPLLTLTKTLATAPTDAGDPITYTLTITAASGVNRATAFDLNLTDTFDANLTALSVSSIITTQGATCVGNGGGATAFSHNGGVFAGNNLTFTASCLDPGQTITLTISGTVAATAPAGYVIPNTANLVYTSLPGPNGTTGNPTGSTTPGSSGADNGERNGSDGVGGAVDDYAATSSVNAPLAAPQVDKLDPIPAQYVIGEQVTFNIHVTLPEGVTQALQVVDDLPLGLEYVSHQVITTAASSSGLLTADFNGTLPAPTVTAPGGSGGDLTLAFGNTTTTDDNVTNNNAFLVRVVARVLNVAGNQNGTILTNRANVSWTGGSATDTVIITLREPELDIQKTANDSAWLYGQTVTFTLILSHLPSSAAAAHDLSVTDTIPAGLTYVAGSITASAGCSPNDTAAPSLTWTCVSLPLASTATLTYQVTVNSPPTPPFLAGNATAVNTANVTWTSQAGNNNPGAGNGERDGSGGVNDYIDSGSHTGGLEQYYSLGNRVWFDTNNNSQIDAGEVGVSGVRVELYAADGAGNPTGAMLAFQNTSAGGYYLFDYLIPGDYVVVIPSSNFSSSGALENYWSSATTRLDTGALTETPAPDPDNDVDRDDNGTLQTSGTFSGAVLSAAVTLGGAPEPTGETDLETGIGQGDQLDNRANMTVDFGFYRVAIGNLIYRDDVADGTYISGDDVPLDGVTVELLSGNGSTVLATTTTAGGGLYLFADQPAGNYIVRVSAPSGLVSTIDTFHPADNADPDANIDDNDNGIGIGPGTAVNVSSGQLTMTPGSTGAQNNNSVSNANGTTDNPTVDFGFVFPYGLGNRVWFDTNNNSQIDAGEVGVNGVTVDLYAADGSGDPTGAVLATDTTANGGYYLFDHLFPGDYVVVIPASNFTGTGALNGYWSSATSMQADGTTTETPAPDPDDDADSDDNGTRQTSGAFNNAVISRAVTLGPNGLTEPTGETDLNGGSQGVQPDDRANMTVDFGFYRVQIGNLVFNDLDKNGAFNGVDTPIANAVVRLYASNGTTEIPVGLDGILGTTDDAPGGMQTNASGEYQFSGLPAGSYIVSVETPAGSSSARDDYHVADNADPNENVDNNDNGIGVGTGEVFSAALTMTPGAAGAQSNNTVNHANGTTADPTVDFGFVTTLFSLGNRVWFDTNNNSQIDAGEVGVDGVTVQLYAADLAGTPIAPALMTDITANGGYYLFDNLAAGDYVVVITASNFAPGGVLVGYWSSATSMDGSGAISETVAPDPDGAPDVDSDDNGQLNLFGTLPGAVASRAVTLGPGNVEPTGESDLESGVGQGTQPDVRANMTVDFGFYRVEVGNLVFIDVNGNGAYDVGDLPLAGATVQLFASNGAAEINVGPDGILGTADDGSGGVTTDADGLYLFSGLPQGAYIVRVTPPVGYASTVDIADGADTTDPNTNTDNNDNGIGVAIGQVSSNAVTLTPGDAQISNTVTNASGTTTNPTVDFGFVSNTGLSKIILGTNAAHTSGLDVTIGEIVTYEVRIELPLGTPLTDVTVTDRMQKGLAFVDCVSVTVAGVNETASVCPPTVSAITDSGDSPTNPANPGRQVVFDLGDIPSQSTAAAVVIQYRAIALDVIENQSGVELNNEVTWAFTGGSFTVRAAEVEIVEPDLAIDKSASPVNDVQLGTPVQFTITINHTSPQSTADAFDVVVTDILPPTLEYIPCSITYSGLAPTRPVAPAYCPGAATDLIFEWDEFPRGQVSIITFNARLLGAPATNVASVAWTSLEIDPGNGGLPVQFSTHNVTSTERWYDPSSGVNIYSNSDSVTINAPSIPSPPEEVDLPNLLPATGFAPNGVTTLLQQPLEKSYSATDVWLEIPNLGVKMPIVGVPLVDGDWDVSWLWKDAGWLNGTAFPGWEGNSALTGHVFMPDGAPGPFAGLGNLKWGDRIIVHAYGSVYTYEVRQNRTVSPSNTTVLKHEEDAWLTLITCKSYNESTNTYASRIAVRAALLSITTEKQESASRGAR